MPDPTARSARPMPVDRDWFKRAVFYEMLVQAGCRLQRQTGTATCRV